MKDLAGAQANIDKFKDRFVTANGQARASVRLSHPETLWFNTGTLCNITCANCYIDSSPENDALVYMSAAEVDAYLDQIAERGWPVREIGFTGGEPFMNPQMIGMADAALRRGYEVLILTNAMRPMMRKAVRAGLRKLQAEHGDRLTLRVSVDHFTSDRHDQERGTGSFARTIEGLEWLRDQGIRIAVAGRQQWSETEAQAREGFSSLFNRLNLSVNAFDPTQTVLFPEMDLSAEVPEITTACWGILSKSPDSVMCASSRMVVKRRGASAPTVVACTLLPYDPQFDLGPTLKDAEAEVHLNHPHCAKFCVLGGASCSA